GSASSTPQARAPGSRAPPPQSRRPLVDGPKTQDGLEFSAHQHRGWGMSELTHLDDDGRARMVDVGAKPTSERRAVARARLRMAPETARAVKRGDGPKGEVLGVARIAGVQAAKQTSNLIPLCHPLPLSYVDVAATVDTEAGLVELLAEARTVGQTGVEMEAMTAASVAALTVYDMVKGLERGVAIEGVVLVLKSGGRSGEWRLDEPAAK